MAEINIQEMWDDALKHVTKPLTDKERLDEAHEAIDAVMEKYNVELFVNQSYSIELCDVRNADFCKVIY